MPAWNESVQVGHLVTELTNLQLNVLVVDDGSTDGTGELAEKAGAVVIRHAVNRGKGESLADGFRYAAAEGYDAVVTMDADGQHDPRDVLRFFDIYNRTGIPVLVGNRMHDRHRMPVIRRITNQAMSRILNRKMRQFVADTQNGFRLYQTDVVMMVIPEATGFAAESEILIKLDEIDIRMGSVPVAAFYGTEKSAVRPIQDTRLFFRMLRRHFAR
ncbi:MAG: glycosyltransferase family 2 protein [Kiritimatiellae bacterium]|nr:glycosyltransferase family 2 protein [Kiritimatiellia bacterium]